MFTYRAKQYLETVQSESATLEEAVNRAAGDLETQAAWPLDVVDEVGNVVLNHDDLYSRADALTVKTFS